MAVETTKPVAGASAPAAQATPAPERPAAPATPATPSTDSNRDAVEPRRPKVDLCWPPPFTSAIPGIAQIRPMCYHLQRFGGPDKE